jgi:hypothetical protein
MDPYLQRLQDAISAATRGLTPAQLGARREGKWSIGEVLEHLYLTYVGTAKGFRRCLEAAKPLASSPTLKHRMSIALVIGAGYMPSGRESPEVAKPRGMPVEEVAAKIGPQIAAMAEAIARCEDRYGARTRLLDHPVLGPLTAQGWRRFHWVHGRHHLKQIERLRTR